MMVLKIRFAFLILFLYAATSSYAQDQKIDLHWETNYQEALSLARQQNKKVLIYFSGSDWSTPCQMLSKDFFYTEKFRKIAVEYLILLRVDLPRRANIISDFHENSNAQLSIKYKQKVYPTVIIVDSNGKMLGKVESYNYLHDTSNHYALINRVLRL